MDFVWIQSFLTAVEQKSLSKAAQKSNISQPALSKHIRNLESILHVTLFNRTPTGITLTEAGAHYYKRITPIMAEVSMIHAELADYNQHHPITIGSLPSIATHYLPAKIADFTFEQRPISLMLQNTSNELFHSLKEGRLDLAFMETNDLPGPSMWRQALFTESYYALFAAHHKYNKKTSVQMTDLYEEPLITHQAPCDVRNHIIQQMNAKGLHPNIKSEVAFGEFVYGAVAVGEGIAIVPELLAMHTKHLPVIALPIVDFGKNRTISLVSRHEKIGSALFHYMEKKDSFE